MKYVMCLRTEISCFQRENKGSETSLMLTLSDVRKLIPHEINTPSAFHQWHEIVAAYRGNWESILHKFITFFLYTIDKISAIEEALLYG